MLKRDSGYTDAIHESKTELRYSFTVSTGVRQMVSAIKRKTSLTLDAEALDSAKALNLNVSYIAETALKAAVAKARRLQWLKDNEAAFAAQSAWHERHGHPLADIISAPGGASWDT